MYSPCTQTWAVPITSITASDGLGCTCEAGLNNDHPNGNKRSLCVRLLVWGSWKQVTWKRIDHLTWWFMGTYLFFLVGAQLEMGTKLKEASYLWSSPGNWALTSAAGSGGLAPQLLLQRLRVWVQVLYRLQHYLFARSGSQWVNGMEYKMGKPKEKRYNKWVYLRHKEKCWHRVNGNLGVPKQ